MTANLKDPVVLTGGDLGGFVVEGFKWKVGTEKEIEPGKVYRRLEDDGDALSKDRAIYTGKVLKK